MDLSGEALGTLTQDESSQTYTYTYHDDQGAEHRVTVVTAASLSKMLDTAMRYHLGGVFVAGLLEPGNDAALADIVRQFANQAPPNTSGELQATRDSIDTDTIRNSSSPLNLLGCHLLVIAMCQLYN